MVSTRSGRQTSSTDKPSEEANSRATTSQAPRVKPRVKEVEDIVETTEFKVSQSVVPSPVRGVPIMYFIVARIAEYIMTASKQPLPQDDSAPPTPIPPPMPSVIVSHSPARQPTPGPSTTAGITQHSPATTTRPTPPPSSLRQTLPAQQPASPKLRPSAKKSQPLQQRSKLGRLLCLLTLIPVAAFLTVAVLVALCSDTLLPLTPKPAFCSEVRAWQHTSQQQFAQLQQEGIEHARHASDWATHTARHLSDQANHAWQTSQQQAELGIQHIQTSMSAAWHRLNPHGVRSTARLWQSALSLGALRGLHMSVAMDLEDVYQLSSQRARAKGKATSMLLTCQHPTACSSAAAAVAAAVQPASHLLLINGEELQGPGAAGELQQRLASQLKSHPNSVVLVTGLPHLSTGCFAVLNNAMSEAGSLQADGKAVPTWQALFLLQVQMPAASTDPAVTGECAASSGALTPGDLDFTAKEQLQLIVASQAADTADYTVPALAQAVRRRIDYVLASHQLGLVA
ncbi:hypothetical protein QJQ45_028677 [Haematococcus lacustris]|nr:hypothetical protein QJQ45_028677 [Haematococcus lacustris]